MLSSQQLAHVFLVTENQSPPCILSKTITTLNNHECLLKQFAFFVNTRVEFFR